MRKKPIWQVRTADEARNLAIDWQIWQSDQSLSYADVVEWQNYFEKLARKFRLTKEFKTEGII